MIAATPEKDPLRETVSAITTDRQLLLLVAMTLASVAPMGLIGWSTSLLFAIMACTWLRPASFAVVAIVTGLLIPVAYLTSGWLGDRLNARRHASQIQFAGVACVCGGRMLGIITALTPSTA